jgi:hypothetical protein
VRHVLRTTRSLETVLSAIGLPVNDRDAVSRMGLVPGERSGSDPLRAGRKVKVEIILYRPPRA